MINIQIIWVTAIVIVLGVSPAWAQDQNAPSDAGMHGHQHDSIIPDTTAAQGDVDAQKRQGMNHDMMPVEESGPEPDVSAKGRNHDGMDHGSMTMQNDSASAEARDPHAYLTVIRSIQVLMPYRARSNSAWPMNTLLARF